MQKEKISFVSATLMNINFMVGSAAFFSPQILARDIGGSGALAWLLGALVMLPVVLAISLAAREMPEADGLFSYAKEAGGPAVASFVSASYSVAIVAVSILYTASFLSAFNRTAKYAVVAALLLTYFLTLRSLRRTAAAQNVGVILKLIPLLGTPFLLIFAKRHGVLTASFGTNGTKALQYTAFGFWGFDAAAAVSRKVEKGAWVSILLGFSVAAAVYAAFTGSVTLILGTEKLASEGIWPLGETIFGQTTLAHLLSSVFKADITLAFFASAITAITAAASLFGASLSEVVGKGLEFKEKTEALLRRYIFPVLAVLTALSVPSFEVFIASANIGVGLAVAVTAFSLAMREWKRGTLARAGLDLLATAISATITYGGYLSIAPTHKERLLLSLPILLFSLAASFSSSFRKGKDKKRSNLGKQD